MLAELTGQGRLLQLDIDGEKVWVTAENVADKLYLLRGQLAEFHQQHPLLGGYPLAELRNQLFPGYSVKQMNALFAYWQQQGELAIHGVTVALPEHQPQPTEQQAEQIARIEAAYQENLFSPPLWNELTASLALKEQEAGEYLGYLLDQGRLIKAGDYYFAAEAPQEALRRLRENESEQGFAAGDIRELLGTNRKYALALLEYTDAHKLTIRVGDKRFCGKQ